MTNFFNNAQSVYINGKEVQSIMLTDSGGILYEKIIAGVFKKFNIEYDTENKKINLQAVDSNGRAVTNNIDDIQNRITVIGGDVDGNYSSPMDISLTNGNGQYTYSLTDNKLNYCLCDWITEDYIHFRQIAWITSEGNVVDFGIRDDIDATSKLTKEDHLTFVLDSAPIYNYLILTPDTFSPDDFVIRYGDTNTLNNEENDGCQKKSNGNSYYYSHTYSTSGQYDVEIYGIQNITSLNILNACILSIDLPKTIKTIGDFNANSLKEIKFNWTESQDIIPYNSQWIIKSDVMMIVPNGTRQLYIDKGYPSTQVYEEPLEFTFEGTELTQYSGGSFSGTNMMIDYGDGTVESTTGKFGHTYSENGTYQVKIYGVTSLGERCFYHCTGLTSINIPEGVISFALSCFDSCADLTSITIPSSVTSFGKGCFHRCPNLTSITIPNGVTHLGDTCFDYCTSLTSINIPDNVINLGLYCFYQCIGLNDYYLNWTSSSQIIAYDSNKMPNNTNTIFHIPIGTKQLYVNKGYPADKLKEPSIMTLTVTGSSFETYSSTPFTYTGEVFVDWGDNSGVVEYTEGKLTHSFTDNLNSHTVRVYGNLISLGVSCFRKCIGLTSITIPSSITSLGNSCFYGCNTLTSITIPDSVTSFGVYCFQNCTGLTSINIPSGVTNLGDACFLYCTSLTSITIPDSVTNLGHSCFKNCTSLTSIILNWQTNSTILTYQSDWMTNISSTLKFHIPAGTKQLYIDKGYPSDKIIDDVGA